MWVTVMAPRFYFSTLHLKYNNYRCAIYFFCFRVGIAFYHFYHDDIFIFGNMLNVVFPTLYGVNFLKFLGDIVFGGRKKFPILLLIYPCHSIIRCHSFKSGCHIAIDLVSEYGNNSLYVFTVFFHMLYVYNTKNPPLLWGI